MTDLASGAFRIRRGDLEMWMPDSDDEIICNPRVKAAIEAMLATEPERRVIALDN